MQVRLKLLIVWLIALALPVQGMASAAMSHCGPGHERARAEPGATNHASAHGARAAHRGDAVLAATADRADQTTSIHAKSQPRKLGDLAKVKCSACASCCAGSALPSVMPSLPELAPAPTDFAQEAVTVDTFVSDGPDRPPRTSLA